MGGGWIQVRVFVRLTDRGQEEMEGGREGIEVVLVTPKGSAWEGSGMGT